MSFSEQQQHRALHGESGRGQVSPTATRRHRLTLNQESGTSARATRRHMHFIPRVSSRDVSAHALTCDTVVLHITMYYPVLLYSTCPYPSIESIYFLDTV